ncbi:MAG: sn-glycerol-3-phosphate ABC transporter ATP-binding protein UgpC [Alphaproteobacteria bacterium]|uniref:ABC transporter ATP-binding protein n=1 Tax=Rhizobium sp. NFR12 TaxID=1566261 RepID=UPI0008A7A1DF|nr:sn-glycerol-3-phosphate ABC transporter ATP-binding protein UgpC [Rhizobium sp. NFR12]RYG99921.1 MAG: sn-glycerol-3-phosphate ABC transporter ATP-binding protein UgpC [Alphaproteobacteria bacterium]SEH26028.1 carbohydrate ABC transporter ATP-binding protein, CUT1 family [Rhizobium sp. NFR12]
MGNVTISKVVKTYGSLEVVHGIDAEIADGEFVVLVGPSGCGKSTLLRMIAGLEDISGGTISIGNRVVNDLPPKSRDISMVFQNYALYPHMTVEENMAFSMTLAGASKEEKSRRVREAAEILGLVPLLERKPKALSGGQRQRVAMGRSIVRDPQVFLFDEPLSNLDAKLRVQMRGEIKSLHRRLRTTMVYVTHDQIEAMTMADRIVVMQSGRIEQVGTPLELYDRPANAFVAQFIGSPAMNLFPAVVADGGLVLAGRRPTGIRAPADARPGQKILVGKRPEEIDIGAETGLEATVTNIEPTGSETFLEMLMDGKSISVVLRDRPQFDVGSRQKLSLSRGAIHLFDEESGKRIG